MAIIAGDAPSIFLFVGARSAVFWSSSPFPFGLRKKDRECGLVLVTNLCVITFCRICRLCNLFNRGLEIGKKILDLRDKSCGAPLAHQVFRLNEIRLTAGGCHVVGQTYPKFPRSLIES